MSEVIEFVFHCGDCGKDWGTGQADTPETLAEIKKSFFRCPLCMKRDLADARDFANKHGIFSFE